MAKTILKLGNLTKTYIMGENKSAKKALKAIHKLHRLYEKLILVDPKKAAQIEKRLNKSQAYFCKEKYELSYKAATGRALKKTKPAKGVVVHALNGIDLEIKEGELVAIMGPSGSGKSTLLNMLGLLDEPSSGKIFIRDEDVTAIKGHRLPEVRSKELGFVFQSFNLIPTLTALENVMLPLKYSKNKIVSKRKLAEDALKKVGLGDRLHHNPNELSGGQRQRVAIARSLVNEPAIIFGDELTGELDTKATQDIMKLIIDLNKKGQTFIIVTHNPEVAALCKRTIHMRDGKIVK
ncbi:MAG: ABC transporter ATP-binding protein [Patescibacteria group bacterium]|nr:ABC transporter ATP-binding protein [Patescibacteria group bacterium]